VTGNGLRVIAKGRAAGHAQAQGSNVEGPQHRPYLSNCAAPLSGSRPAAGASRRTVTA
jgi:hypothetical protein